MRYCFLILFCLAGCCGRDGYIKVQHEYLDTQYLASCHVDSPDPRRCNFFGQQLIIQWKFPRGVLINSAGPDCAGSGSSIRSDHEAHTWRSRAECSSRIDEPEVVQDGHDRVNQSSPKMRKGLYLILKVRNRNETIETVRIPIKKRRGSTIYRLTGRRYCERDGILTYQIDVMEGDCLLERWSHQVWADLIEIKDDE